MNDRICQLYWILLNLWTDCKDYLKKFTSASDIDLDIQKFCIEIPVSVEKLLKVSYYFELFVNLYTMCQK